MGTVGSNPTPSATQFESGVAYVRTAIVLAALTVVLLVPATSAAAKVNKADVAIQKQAVLRKSDLSAGWRSSPDQPLSLPSDPTCAALQEANDALEPVATESPDYWKSDWTRAHNAVAVLATPKQARGWLARYAEPDAATCLEEAMKDTFAQPGIQGVRVYVAPMNDTPRGADDAVGFEIQITATDTSSAQTLVIIYDTLVVRVGRALTNFAFMNVANPLPEQDELVDAVIGRLQDAGI